MEMVAALLVLLLWWHLVSGYSSGVQTNNIFLLGSASGDTSGSSSGSGDSSSIASEGVGPTCDGMITTVVNRPELFYTLSIFL